jgi:hypothetical protein
LSFVFIVSGLVLMVMSWLERRRDVLHGNYIEGRTRMEMTNHDPNEAYEVVPVASGQHGTPEGWWTVKRNGIAVRHFPSKEKAQRYATDPEYRASLVSAKVWQKAKGK